MNVNKPLYMKDDNNDWINILLKKDYFKEIINSNDNNSETNTKKKS